MKALSPEERATIEEMIVRSPGHSDEQIAHVSSDVIHKRVSASYVAVIRTHMSRFRSTDTETLTRQCVAAKDFLAVCEHDLELARGILEAIELAERCEEDLSELGEDED